MSRDTHLLLSDNDATGVSLNFSPEMTCWHPLCPYCYAMRRDKEQAAQLCRQFSLCPGDITSNNGPITWSAAQAAYKRNVLVLRGVSSETVNYEARRLATSLRRRGYDNLRINGCGDFFNESVLLTHELAKLGIRVWGFSRKPNMISKLASLAAAFRTPGYVRPIIWGSVDQMTERCHAAALITACSKLHHWRTERVLAYMALPSENPSLVRGYHYWPNVRTVLGYHATGVHTHLSMARECPKTGGKGITCQTCKRCFK